MSLIVEDGSIFPGAESYISVSEANLYHDNLGNTAWAAANVPQKEQALRKATNYMTALYSSKWRGSRVSAGQVLDWPRDHAYVHDFLVPSTAIPSPIKTACADLAVRTFTEVLLEDRDRRTVREKVGVIEVEYEGGASRHMKFEQVSRLLDPYLQHGGSSNTISLMRV